MKKMCVLVAILGLILCLQGLASAQSSRLLGSLSKESNSVTKVMLEAKCDFSWLSQVIADSDIDVSQLRQLPIGKEVFIRNGSCIGIAPEGIGNLSFLILRMDLTQTPPSNLEGELANLRESLETKATQYERVVTENAKLKREVADLEGKLGKLTAVAPVEVNTGVSIPLFMSFVIFCIAVIGICIGLLRIERSKFSYPSTMTIKENGKSYKFTFAGVTETSPNSRIFIAKYACPLCSERNLYQREKNLRTHIKKAHPSERIDLEVDQELRSA